jgi:hypothetical protein
VKGGLQLMKNSNFKLEEEKDVVAARPDHAKFGHGKKRADSYHHHHHTDSFEFQGHGQKTEKDPKKCGDRRLHDRAFIFRGGGLHRGH